MSKAEFGLRKAIFLVTNGYGQIWHVAMNWEEAREVTELCNATVHGEGKFTFTEVSSQHSITITSR